MLRDGVTGDWYVDSFNYAGCMLTVVGLVHSLATKEQSGKPVFLQMRPWQLQLLETTQRTYPSVDGAPDYC